jgi:hypothetical protein
LKRAIDEYQEVAHETRRSLSVLVSDVCSVHDPLSFALGLVWLDTLAARGLLEPLLPRFKPGLFLQVQGPFIWTMAALDPQWAAEVILGWPPDNPQEYSPRANALLTFIRYLTTEPEKRRDYVMAQYGLWVPGFSEE